jgi:DNA (cytosine-5)-methyltransferase 1
MTTKRTTPNAEGLQYQLADAGPLRAAELFAGVGGFRLGLEQAGFQVVWSNQWEPSTKVQHASDCYVEHFGADGHTSDDIAEVLNRVEAEQEFLPEHDLLVGGFPCQDYSVAKALSHAHGLVGKKGVLWWEIQRLLHLRVPRYVLLENVDRLLKSPASQRGRDFAIILASLAHLGYRVEWRVVNAADYGFPQRRRRVFIFAERTVQQVSDPGDWLTRDGVLAKALPVQELDKPEGANSPTLPEFAIDTRMDVLTNEFGKGRKISQFANAGLMQGFMVWTTRLTPVAPATVATLGDVLDQEESIPEEYFIPDGQLKVWEYLKGAKKEPRTHQGSGTTYFYNEGAVAFPEPLDQPSRTVLTGEGGPSPSRFKHVVPTPSGRLRRLVPQELERLNGFPSGWTEGMPNNRRAFMMGNALVVGVVAKIGCALREYVTHRPSTKELREPSAGYLVNTE